MAIAIRTFYRQTATLTNATATFQDLPGMQFVMPPKSSFHVDIYFQQTGSAAATGAKSQLLNADAADSLLIVTLNSTGPAIGTQFGKTTTSGDFNGSVRYTGRVTNPGTTAKTLSVQGALQAVGISSATFAQGSIVAYQLT
jgi:hypothetical protein